MNSWEMISIWNDRVFIRDISSLNNLKTITNDAETVCIQLNYIAPKRRIIYLDTDLEWWELVHENGKFISFKKYTESNYP